MTLCLILNGCICIIFNNFFYILFSTYIALHLNLAASPSSDFVGEWVRSIEAKYLIHNIGVVGTIRPSFQ